MVEYLISFIVHMEDGPGGTLHRYGGDFRWWDHGRQVASGSSGYIGWLTRR